MATLTLQTINESGDDVTLNTPDDVNGDLVSNAEGETVLLLDNTGASAGSCTVTITSNKTTFNSPNFGPSQKASVAISLGANDVKVAGKFAKVPFNNSDGQLDIQYSGDVTGLTVGVFRNII